MYIHTNTWIAGKNLKRQVYHQKMRFTAGLKGISDQDYEHAEKIFNIMEKKILGCYHDTHLKTDVSLLADVFETFRNTRLKNYNLDSAHFYTARGLVWKALFEDRC